MDVPVGDLESDVWMEMKSHRWRDSPVEEELQKFSSRVLK